MGKLRTQMLMEMRLRNYSPKTIKAYLWHADNFAKRFGKSPAEMGSEEIRQHLYWMLHEQKLSWSNANIAYSALKFLYVQTLHRNWDVAKIPRAKGGRRLPVVLSQKEVIKVLTTVPNLKHRVILTTIYSGGLRLNEALHLKISDIDSDRMQIRVEQGKGKKDRHTLLSERALVELRSYWRAYRPTLWLFPGKKPSAPLRPSSIQQAFQNAKKKPVSINVLPSTLCAIVLRPIF
jgi:integrase/recombinase XerD